MNPSRTPQKAAVAVEPRGSAGLFGPRGGAGLFAPRGVAALLALALLASTPYPAAATDAFFPSSADGASAGAAEAALAVEAYAYAYPLVLMELTRRVETNVGDAASAKPVTTITGGARAPMNAFAHQRTLFDATTIAAGQRPNADVLTSSLWYDVGPEPLVVTIPDAGSRWYTLPMFDLWSDVFAAPGPRTTGGGAQRWAITKRGWTGMLPAGVGRIEAPTETGRVLLRIRADGPADYPAVHAFQDALRATPLSHFGEEWSAPASPFDAGLPMQPPADRILRLSTAEFFEIFANATTRNPPHAHDHPILQRMSRIGLAPGRPFAPHQLEPVVRARIQSTPTTAGQQLFDAVKRAGTRANGWRLLASPMGAYGVDYRRRQVVAYSALGADLSEDVLYLTTIAAGDGKPLEAAHRYTVHFDPATLPPADAFWSLTVYDDRQLLAPNALKRFSIGDRTALAKNADGSIDVVLQSEHPGPDKVGNWLPTSGEGRFTLVLRLYAPKAAALDGSWQPPPVTRVGD